MDGKGANKEKKTLRPRRRALPYRMERQKIKLPVLPPEEWFMLIAAGND